MKRFLILFSFLFINQSFAQKKLQDADWIAILSGNIEAYQKYHIKNLKLTNNNELIKNISYDKKSKMLEIFNKITNSNSIYLFDNQNRVTEIRAYSGLHQFKYKDSEINEYIFRSEQQDSIITEKRLSIPYTKNPQIQWYEHFKINKNTNKKQLISSQKRVLNPKDSLWGYDEERKNQNFTRRYFNKNNVTFTHVNSDISKYDSTYIKANGKAYHLIDNRSFDKLEREISVEDSLYNFSFIQNKLIHKKITKSGELKRELFYNQNNEKLNKTINYTYYPIKDKDSRLLWMISTKDENTQKIVEVFPNKGYYRLKNNVLIESRNLRKLTESRVLGCGTTSSMGKQIFYYYIFDVTSTSIIADTKRILDNIDTDAINMDLYENDVEQAYIRWQFSHILENRKAIYSGIFKPKKLSSDITNEMYRLRKTQTRKKDLVKDWKVELTTEDGRIYSTDVLPLFDKLVYNVDFMISKDE